MTALRQLVSCKLRDCSCSTINVFEIILWTSQRDCSLSLFPSFTEALWKVEARDLLKELNLQPKASLKLAKSAKCDHKYSNSFERWRKLCWTENLQPLLSSIRPCYSSITVPVDAFDVERLANTDMADPLTSKTNCCKRKMLFAWLWCPRRGPLKSPPITMWTTQRSSVYSPFHFYWSDDENPLEKKLNAFKKSTTAMLRWETGLVDIDSNRLCTLRLLHICAMPAAASARIQKGATLARSDCCSAA